MFLNYKSDVCSTSTALATLSTSCSFPSSIRHERFVDFLLLVVRFVIVVLLLRDLWLVQLVAYGSSLVRLDHRDKKSANINQILVLLTSASLASDMLRAHAFATELKSFVIPVFSFEEVMKRWALIFEAYSYACYFDT